MFTGLVEEVGTVLSLTPITSSDTEKLAYRLEIAAETVVDGTKIGDSISVSGVCLTVTSLTDNSFFADIMPQTAKLTALSQLQAGSSVNLERALLPTTRLGGHFVQGHVDAVATLKSRTIGETWHDFTFEIPAKLANYIVPQGSICVAGVSLTVTTVSTVPVLGEYAEFSVSLIPETLLKTNLASLEVGQLVNIEVDVLAKYTERLIKGADASAD